MSHDARRRILVADDERSLAELVARVRALLRRFGQLEIDVVAREVHLTGQPVELTRVGVNLLAVRSARPTAASTRRQVITAAWGDAWVGDEHPVDVPVGHLRRKPCEDPSAPHVIRTIGGVGYRMGDGS